MNDSVDLTIYVLPEVRSDPDELYLIQQIADQNQPSLSHRKKIQCLRIVEHTKLRIPFLKRSLTYITYNGMEYIILNNGKQYHIRFCTDEYQYGIYLPTIEEMVNSLQIT